MNPFAILVQAVLAEQAVCFVRIAASDGSTPRDADAWMAVRPSGQFHGTIGGGVLEFNAIAQARAYLEKKQRAVERQSIALGPGLGQCCGGRVVLHFEIFTAGDLDTLEALAKETPPQFVAAFDAGGRVQRKAAGQATTMQDGEWRENYATLRTALLLFGAGHVARALVLALAPLPFAIRWIETRKDAFPAIVPGTVECIVTDNPVQEIRQACDASIVLVMTHSHTLDLEICAAALQRETISYTGVIGSSTKRARFVSQLARAGLSQTQIAALGCPIGLPGLQGKEPAVIAASVAADLLLRRNAGR